MEKTSDEVVDQLKKEETQSNNEDVLDSVDENREQDASSLIKDEKGSDSDANSEDLSSNDEQNNVNSDSSPQFYESSDSKLDYAVKIDDNDTLSDIDDIKTDTASADSEDSALGSLPPDTAESRDREEEAQDRSDGSDSGIGSETPEDAKIPNFNLALPCTSDRNEEESTEETKESKEVREEIKNETIIEQGNTESTCDSTAQIIRPQKSNLKRKCEDESNADQPQSKRRKEGIKFDTVTVYYFPRAQGFSCVPSQGGSTLGMESEHSHVQKFTLAEHALEQRRLHRQILQQIKNERHSLEGEALSSSEDSDTEEETSDISDSELDLDSYYFLQPVPTRQRRALLRAAGVRKIEGYEKDECRDIRTSREFCGCACKGTCNPETCLCSLGGIKCQVDRLNFPCGCTRDGCANTSGRIEFNPVRVRTHFIHTLMRIGLEKKNEENQEAAKRQWAALNASTTSANTSYDSERCLSHEDGLLRDVSLTPRVEVESCVNNGSFNNVHCEMNNSTAHPNIQDNSNYGYVNDALSQKNINANNIMHFDNGNTHHNLNQVYTNNILQGKGPPYTTGNTMGFDTMSSNMQRFPCDLNYSYEQHMENHYKAAQSYSATSFEEFAHTSQMTMFSQYSHMYAPEYFHKPSTSMHDHSLLHYHHIMPQQNQYGIYKTTPECINADNNKNESHYTTLMTMPYQSSNKLQTVENDENWYSQNSLMSLDHSDQTTQDSPELQAQPVAPAPPADNLDNLETTENFGELIKKTMVDSVTV